MLKTEQKNVVNCRDEVVCTCESHSLVVCLSQARIPLGLGLLNERSNRRGNGESFSIRWREGRQRNMLNPQSFSWVWAQLVHTSFFVEKTRCATSRSCVGSSRVVLILNSILSTLRFFGLFMRAFFLFVWKEWERCATRPERAPATTLAANTWTLNATHNAHNIYMSAAIPAYFPWNVRTAARKIPSIKWVEERRSAHKRTLNAVQRRKCSQTNKQQYYIMVYFDCIWWKLLNRLERHNQSHCVQYYTQYRLQCVTDVRNKF